MTKEEIQALISAKIAGQGNQVDSGGALATILAEILDLVGQGGGGEVKPIVLTEAPTSEMTTQAELDAIGLTVEEMQAAAEGKRTGVVFDGCFYPITQAFLIGEHSEGVCVTFIATGDDSEKFAFIEGFEVRSENEVVTVVGYAN